MKDSISDFFSTKFKPGGEGMTCGDVGEGEGEGGVGGDWEGELSTENVSWEQFAQLRFPTFPRSSFEAVQSRKPSELCISPPLTSPPLCLSLFKTSGNRHLRLLGGGVSGEEWGGGGISL